MHWVYINFYGDLKKRVSLFSAIRSMFLPQWNKKINTMGDFLGGPVVEDPPSNEGDAGSIPGLGTSIPHAVGQLSCPLQLEASTPWRRACTAKIQKWK